VKTTVARMLTTEGTPPTAEMSATVETTTKAETKRMPTNRIDFEHAPTTAESQAILPDRSPQMSSFLQKLN